MSTLNTFAWQLGAHARITREYSLQWHKAYVKADEAAQTAWRTDFIVHFVMGYFSDPEKGIVFSEDEARKIVGMKRTERTKAQENACAAGREKFKYHIVRPDATAARTEDAEPAKPTKVRVSAAEREAYEALLAACGGDIARVKVVVAALNK